MSLTLRVATRFQRDMQRMVRRRNDLTKFQHVIEILVAQQPLPSRYHDHALTGSLHTMRDLHVEPDWLVIYRIDHDRRELILLRTGTHADLFKE